MAAKLPIAATPRALKIAEPTIVPIPMSDPVRKVEITLTKNSGHEVATDMKVAAATSCKINRVKLICFSLIPLHNNQDIHG